MGDLIDVLLSVWNLLVDNFPAVAAIVAGLLGALKKVQLWLVEVLEAVDAVAEVLTNGATKEEVEKARKEIKDVTDLFRGGMFKKLVNKKNVK